MQLWASREMIRSPKSGFVLLNAHQDWNTLQIIPQGRGLLKGGLHALINQSTSSQAVHIFRSSAPPTTKYQSTSLAQDTSYRKVTIHIFPRSAPPIAKYHFTFCDAAQLDHYVFQVQHQHDGFTSTLVWITAGIAHTADTHLTSNQKQYIHAAQVAGFFTIY